MTRALRLDAELVRRGLVDSRTAAQRAIEDGRVTVRGVPASSAAARVVPEAAIALLGPEPRFVSRGGDKLDGALDRLSANVKGRRWLDVGASTGGFTDCLLQRGAIVVAAVDVGYGQLAWRLRNDERVVVLERTNARSLTPTDLPWRPDGVVGDVSFISLTLLLPVLIAVAAPDADHILLVKPQFEVGRKAIQKGGVVRDREQWRAALTRVVASAESAGLALVDAVASPLVGPAGNREFFVHFRLGARPNPNAIEFALSGAP